MQQHIFCEHWGKQGPDGWVARRLSMQHVSWRGQDFAKTSSPDTTVKVRNIQRAREKEWKKRGLVMICWSCIHQQKCLLAPWYLLTTISLSWKSTSASAYCLDYTRIQFTIFAANTQVAHVFPRGISNTHHSLSHPSSFVSQDGLQKTSWGVLGHAPITQFSPCSPTRVLTTCKTKTEAQIPGHALITVDICLSYISIHVSVPWLLAEASASSAAAISPGLSKPQRKITAEISKFQSQKHHKTSWNPLEA